MPTTLMCNEELTIALEFAIIELYLMVVIFTVESKVERIEPESGMFLGITLGFFNLSY
jgi:hypothetical protein